MKAWDELMTWSGQYSPEDKQMRAAFIYVSQPFATQYCLAVGAPIPIMQGAVVRVSSEVQDHQILVTSVSGSILNSFPLEG